VRRKGAGKGGLGRSGSVVFAGNLLLERVLSLQQVLFAAVMCW